MPPDIPTDSGFRASDLLSLPSSERRVLQWLMRQGAGSLREVADHFQLMDEDAESILLALEKQGYIFAAAGNGPKSYRPRFGSSRPAGAPSIDIWSKLTG
ncbi:MAG: hypothetical protein PHT19_03180 [Methylococcus sp.]|nr:hypothetical protein [Methylococcus sp.]